MMMMMAGYHGSTRVSSLLSLVILLLLTSNVTSQGAIRTFRTNTQCSKATVVPSRITERNPYVDNTTTFDNGRKGSEYDKNPPKLSCTGIRAFDSYVYNSTKDKVRSAWYRFTPSISQYYDFKVSIGSLFDWSFNIVEGTSCTGFTKTIGCRSESARGVYLTANKTYFITLIEVPYFDLGKGGDLNFSISPTTKRPQNDNCMNAFPIASSVTLPYTIRSSTPTNATLEPNEILPSCDRFVSYVSGLYDNIEFKDTFGGHSIWYTYAPPITGYYNFSTIGTIYYDGPYIQDAPITIAVYEATTSVNNSQICSNMTNHFREVHCSQNIYSVDRISELNAGKLYYIQLVPDMYKRPVGKAVKLTISRTSPPPTNDKCSGAIAINPTKGVNNATVDVRFASSEALTYPDGIMCGTSNVSLLGNGVWYKYVHTGGVNEIRHRLCYPFREDFKYYVLTGDGCANDNNLQCVGEFTSEGLSSGFTFFFDYCSPYETLFTVEKPTTYWFLLGPDVKKESSVNFSVEIKRRNQFFRWIDASNDTFIEQPIYDAPYSLGSRYDDYPTYLSSSKLNIGAYFQPELNVQSALVTFTNPNVKRCEKSAPFSIFGDSNGNYSSESIPIGNHTVTAIPYTQPGCRGPPLNGSVISNTFTTAGCDLSYYFDPFSDDVIFLRRKDRPVPCTALLGGFVECSYPQQDISIELYDAITNKSIVGDTLQRDFKIRGGGLRDAFYFGKLDTNAKYDLSPINLPPSSKYVLTVTIDSIRQPPYEFSIEENCVP